MAQQIINIGATADDSTGDTVRDAFDKTNDNFTELYDEIGADTRVYVSQESDFPVQDATTITVEANTAYYLSASFSTAKNIVVQNGSALLGPWFETHAITFTGAGVFMTGTDASIYIRDVQLIMGATNQAFSFSDTIGDIYRFTTLNLSVIGGAKWGTFDDLRSVQCINTCLLYPFPTPRD